MATAAEKKKAYEEWKERCRQVQAITDTSLLKSETPVERDMRIKRLLNNYAAFCEYYFPHFLQLRDKTTGEVIRTIHNAPFHNEAARKVRNTPDLKAVFMWPRVIHTVDGKQYLIGTADKPFPVIKVDDSTGKVDGDSAATKYTISYTNKVALVPCTA